MRNLHESAYDVCQEAVAILREEQVLNEDAVLTGVKTVDGVERQANKAERACHRSYERARHNVMDSFAWSFLKREAHTSSWQDGHGRFRTAYPGQAEVKIVGCYGPDGRRVQWSVFAREYIVSDEPIHRIVYIEDEPDVTQWPRLVRNALVYAVASAIAIELTGRAADQQMCDQKMTALVQQARTDDARQSGTGSYAYGRNYLYDVATGRRMPNGIGFGRRW